MRVINIKNKHELGLEKLNPLILSMVLQDAKDGKTYILRENTDSNFYNSSDIIDEKFHKRISTITIK